MRDLGALRCRYSAHGNHQSPQEAPRSVLGEALERAFWNKRTSCAERHPISRYNESAPQTPKRKEEPGFHLAVLSFLEKFEKRAPFFSFFDDMLEKGQHGENLDTQAGEAVMLPKLGFPCWACNVCLLFLLCARAGTTMLLTLGGYAKHCWSFSSCIISFVYEPLACTVFGMCPPEIPGISVVAFFNGIIPILIYFFPFAYHLAEAECFARVL